MEAVPWELEFQVSEYMAWQLCKLKYFLKSGAKMGNAAGADVLALEWTSSF